MKHATGSALFATAGSLLTIHVVLWTASMLGVPWSRPLVVCLWTVLALYVSRLVVRSVPGPIRLDRRDLVFRRALPSLASALGLAAFGALALASWQGWNVHPDWVFHWGPKALRFALAEGIDLHYLTRPWNFHIHPDYPTLLPNLTASLSLALGVPVTPRLGAVVTLGFAALWLLALRTLALRLANDSQLGRWVAEAAWVTAAWSVTLFGTGFRQAAGADLPFGAAVTLGTLALCAPRKALRSRSLRPDLHVALAAALAAQLKFEGAVFAALLVMLWCLRRTLAAHPRRRPQRLARTLAGSALLPGALVAAWILWNRHHGLFLPSNAGSLDLSRLGTVAAGLWRAAFERAWHGLPLALLTLPWLCLRREIRWPALLLSGQLAAYVGVYLTTPVDLDLLLLTSASRLAYHLVPTLLVLLVVALGGQSLEPGVDSTDTSSDEPVSPTFLA